jgi:DNA gyrase subunit A
MEIDDMTKEIKAESIAEVLVDTFKVYAKYVIQDRALPDVRDGLKPAQRRLLWTMYLLKALSSSQHRKSAKIAGETMGSFHPHGSAYGTLVNMAQNWVFNAPLVDGKGNFGNIDGDGPAADRYTEARLSKYSDMVFFPRRLREEEEIVPFVPNYDNTQKEPVVFPALLPNILVNGSTGIAVGMATDIPPFNLSEVCDALISIIDGKDSFEALIKILPAPDLPTGGVLEADKSELRQIYELGKGRLRLRGKIHIVHNERGTNLIISQIPYGLNKKALLENLFEKTQFSVKTVKDPRTGAKTEKKIEPVIKGVKSVEDFSGGENGPVHIAVEIAPGHDPKKVANQLLKETKLQGALNPNITVIVNKKPVQTGVLGLLNYFIKFRQATIKREFTYEKEQAEKRSHILEGRLVAYKNKDRILKIIHGTPTVEAEREKLAKEFGLSEIQISDIRALPQYAFKKAEIGQVQEELKTKKKFIAFANNILRSKAELNDYMKEQILELKQQLGTERKTQLEEKFTEIQDLDTVTKQDVVLLVTSDNTIKTTPIEEYRVQRKGGKGALGISVEEGVRVKFMGQVSTHDTVWIITDMGNRYILPVRFILPTPKTRKGKPIQAFVPGFSPDENIVDAIIVSTGSESKFLVIINEEGMIKRMSMADLMTKRATTTQIFPVDTGPKIVSAKVMDEEEDVFIASTSGQGLRFPLSILRTVISLAAGGVQSISLGEDDSIISLSAIALGDELVFVSDIGYAKRVLEGDIARKKGKVGIGVRVNPENAGKLVLADTVFGDQLIMITSEGKAIRVNIDEIGTYRRTARGQRIQKMKAGEEVTAAAQINTNIIES